MKKMLMSSLCAATIAFTNLVAAHPSPALAQTAEGVSNGPVIPREQIEAAMPELVAAGVVTAQKTTGSGDVVSTPDLGRGLVVDMTRPGAASSARITGGRDSRGVWIQFNTVDQNLILSGGAWMMSAGICAAFGLVSGGAACVVVGAITTAALDAISADGGTCSNRKQLRVWVSGSSKPKCV